MIKILVTGCLGQLGSEIREVSNAHPEIQFVFTDFKELDITSKTALEEFVKSEHFSYLINCAAYTNVDKAEEDRKAAELLNTTALVNLAEVCSNFNIIPIHISTDYVFSGEGFKPYLETEPTIPKSNYGKTKLDGEIILVRNCPNHIIIRTSWLYSPFGKNFLKTMINLGQQKDELSVVSDQIGTPTYAFDLANAIIHIVKCIEKASDFSDYGIYHYSNEGVCSWYDFATEIQTACKNSCIIKPIESKDYKTLAPRPYFSVLNKSKIKHIFELDIPHWRGRISHCINRIIS